MRANKTSASWVTPKWVKRNERKKEEQKSVLTVFVCLFKFWPGYPAPQLRIAVADV